MSDSLFSCGKQRTIKSLFGAVLVLTFVMAGQASAVVDWPVLITWDIEYEGGVLPTADGWSAATSSDPLTVVSLTYGTPDYLTVDTTAAAGTAQHFYNRTGFSTDFSNGAVLEMRARMNGGVHTGGFTVGDNLGWIGLDFLSSHLKVTSTELNYVAVDTSEWHSYGLVINGTNWSVYIDGNLKLSGSTLANYDQDFLQFGDRSNTNTWNSDVDYDYFRYADGPLLSCSAPIQGDVNNDCTVDLEDFAFMASNWMQCTPILEEASFFEEIDVFINGTEGYACYRIPAIITAPNGDLLAFCEGRKYNCDDAGNIDIVMKRSTDNGQTWEPLELVYEEGGSASIAIANPCPVVDESNGRLWMPFCRNANSVFVGYSDDSGYTWSARQDITSQVKPAGWTWYVTGPGVGIQLKNEPYSGRLVIPSDHYYGGAGSHMIYSDDHGATWNCSERIAPGGNECQAVELIDGTVMNNARTYNISPTYRGIATSDDGGQSWSDMWLDPALPEPVCQASFLRYTRSDTEDINRILFSNPPQTSGRFNLTVKLSYDEASTWPVARQIYAGSSAYSCLVVMPNWNVGCLYEKDNYTKITLASFSLRWITDGADSLILCSAPILGDLNNDCEVNLEDFALMASNWLQCNLVPAETCS